MNAKQMVLLVVAALVLLSTPAAQAFYNPHTGRWLSRDPIEEEGAVNLYAFNYDVPQQYIDPDGRHPAVIIAIAVLILYPDNVNAPGPDDPHYPPGNSAQGAIDVATGIGVGAVVGKGLTICCKFFGKAKPLRFQSGHGGRHLKGTGLSQAAVENAIKQQVQAATKNASCTGSFWGRVQVGGKTIEYRAFTLPDGTINIGTYYPL